MNNSTGADISACSRKNIVNQRLVAASMWLRLMLFPLFSICMVMVLLLRSTRQPVVDEQLFQFVGAQGLRDDLHLVTFDLPGQGPVFIGLRMRAIEFDNGLAVDFGPLHHVVPGDEMDHLGAQLGGQGLDQRNGGRVRGFARLSRLAVGRQIEVEGRPTRTHKWIPAGRPERGAAPDDGLS